MESDTVFQREISLSTGWRRRIGCLKLQVIFCERATMCRALSRKMTCRDKASYDSTPPCTVSLPYPIERDTIFHRERSHIAYLYRSFLTKEPYNWWLFCHPVFHRERVLSLQSLYWIEFDYRFFIPIERDVFISP